VRSPFSKKLRVVVAFFKNVRIFAADMKRQILTLALLAATLGAMAQTAREVLDRCAATISVKEGVKAQFTMTSAQFGNTSGTIAVKGRMFHATTPVASMWFDGKTQWTYLERNDEVNVTTPTEQQLEAINPYNFINLYKQGFKSTLTATAEGYVVHLTADDQKRRIKEMFITVDEKSYAPTEVKLLHGSRWTVFAISSLEKAALADSEFRFNKKDFPSAEVIDLR
jgi:outer membrane lipoprotein-sorting protein